ncbi:MAG: amidase [Paracoccaceae bacterium]|jgi:aspartyl-tRNA(Asn)/glutamyl-tRNA(Gln) amidotransferase subunit A|nr:amidase [Paracoccaceae bacterium]
MSTSDLHYLTALEQAELIRTREISPVDLVSASLDRIDRYDDTLRAWITVKPELALEEARKAEAEIASGTYRGPLHGLPYGVKDQMHAVGFPTTLGTKVLDEPETVAPEDAVCIARLKEAGAILIGKQNLHEFGKGGTIDFPFGQPRNPWDPDYTASSSSSGSGIAPAAGMCSFAIGQDTGGSVRGPASCNGIVGMRPTHGRISRRGCAMHAYTSDTLGPLARTVPDLAAVLQAICGHDPKDPLSAQRPVPDFSERLGEGVSGMRLAVVREMAWGDSTDPEVRAAFQAAVETLERAGAQIEEVSLPLAKWAVPLQLLSADADVASYFLKNYLRERYMRFDRGTRTRLAASSLIPASAYNRAMRARVLVRRQVLEAVGRYDALLSPTNVTPPKRIEATQERVDRKDELVTRLIERRICHYPFSLANVPALSVPMGFSRAGLPLALQIAGKPFDESTLLQIGCAYEVATEWSALHPDLDRTLRLVA